MLTASVHDRAASEEQRLLTLCARLGILVEDRRVTGAMHHEPTWNGTSLRWPLHGMTTKYGPEHWLAHEIGHWLVAPHEARGMPNYGFRRDPHSMCEIEVIRPEFAEDCASPTRWASEDEEGLALWLGIIVGDACGLDPDEACRELSVTGGDFECMARDLAELAGRGLIEPGPVRPAVGPWRLRVERLAT
jgi:hypothetical protein